MKTLHYSIIVILVTSLIVVNNPVFADNTTSTSYGGLVGFRQAYFQGNHGSYPIWYKLTNGTAVSTLLDLPAKALLFMIKASSDGQLIVELPRTIIDSKNQSIDKPYFVGVGGVTTGLSQVNATETSDDYLRTLKIDFTKNTDEIEIVGTFFVENYSSMTKHSSVLLSPLKQFKSGIAANDVKCKENLQLIMKSENSFPACVKPDTAQKLVERGWAMAITSYTQQNIPALSSSIEVPNTNFTINYDFAGNGRILNANMDIQSKSLILSLETTSNGTLTVSIPRALLDIKKNDRGMGEFYILADGRETIFKEIHTTLTDRVFSIPFQDGTKKIQIIATELI